IVGSIVQTLANYGGGGGLHPGVVAPPPPGGSTPRFDDARKPSLVRQHISYTPAAAHTRSTTAGPSVGRAIRALRDWRACAARGRADRGGRAAKAGYAGDPIRPRTPPRRLRWPARGQRPGPYLLPRARKGAR